MRNRANWAVMLTAVTGGVWLILLAHPATRWMVVRHLDAFLSPPRSNWMYLKDLGVKEPGFEVGPWEYGNPEQAPRSIRSSEYELLLAQALETTSQNKTLAQLRSLEARFPNRAD